MEVTLFGLKTCDTCRKAAKELGNGGMAVIFRDVRLDPLAGAERQRFLDAFGDALVNQRSTTWRALEAAEKESTPNDLLAAHPTLMKRPVVDGPGGLTLGWTAATKAAHLAT